jgi:hypothetical protein
VQRRVPASERAIHGATLVVSTMGGYSVIDHGAYLGYLHASLGDKFNVYRHRREQMDEHLGKATIEDGVLMILIAAGLHSRTQAS